MEEEQQQGDGAQVPQLQQEEEQPEQQGQGHQQQHEAGTGQQHDARLDFTSPEFDAALALQTPGLRVPVPDALVLDNVSKCAGLLPPAEPGAQDQPPAAQHQPTSEAKKAKAAALKQRAQLTAQRAAASVRIAGLPSIMAAAAVGPLAVLARWQAAAQRVYVVTRHASGVRGRAVGTLLGFDRFLNLLLRDVEEHYTVMVKVQRTQQQPDPQQPKQQQPQQQQQPDPQQPLAGTHEVPGEQQQQQTEQQQQQEQQQEQQQGRPPGVRTRTRWCRKQEHRYRQLDQVLLRGDSVVLVSGTAPAKGLGASGAAPGTAATAAAAAAAGASGRQALL